MASERFPQTGHADHDSLFDDEDAFPKLENGVFPEESQHHPYAESKTPEPRPGQQSPPSDTPGTPGLLPPFDWDDFEARYEQALQEADAHESEILKESEKLSRYFKVWASAASAHDDERAVKRLQTRARFVNLSEERMVQKQQHYDEVVRAFESALALLKSN